MCPVTCYFPLRPSQVSNQRNKQDKLATPIEAHANFWNDGGKNYDNKIGKWTVRQVTWREWWAHVQGSSDQTQKTQKSIELAIRSFYPSIMADPPGAQFSNTSPTSILSGSLESAESPKEDLNNRRFQSFKSNSCGGMELMRDKESVRLTKKLEKGAKKTSRSPRKKKDKKCLRREHNRSSGLETEDDLSIRSCCFSPDETYTLGSRRALSGNNLYELGLQESFSDTTQLKVLRRSNEIHRRRTVATAKRLLDLAAARKRITLTATDGNLLRIACLSKGAGSCVTEGVGWPFFRSFEFDCYQGQHHIPVSLSFKNLLCRLL